MNLVSGFSIRLLYLRRYVFWPIFYFNYNFLVKIQLFVTLLSGSALFLLPGTGPGLKANADPQHCLFEQFYEQENFSLTETWDFDVVWGGGHCFDSKNSGRKILALSFFAIRKYLLLFLLFVSCAFFYRYLPSSFLFLLYVPPPPQKKIIGFL